MTKESLQDNNSIFVLTEANAKNFAQSPGFYKFLFTDIGICIGNEEVVDHLMLSSIAESLGAHTFLDAGAVTVTKFGDIWLNGISTKLRNARKLSDSQCIRNRSLSVETIAEMVGEKYKVSGNL